MQLKGILLFIIALAGSSINCQITDSVFVIQEVVAKGPRFGKYTLGANVSPIDSSILQLYQTNSVAEILNFQSLVAIHTYGPEGLATVSMRGGSSRHTTIIWNGFNLRNASSGSINFSVLSAGFVDKLDVQMGGASTMYGSGATSGSIFITNSLKLGEKKPIAVINLDLGSYNTKNFIGTVGIQSQKFSTRIKLGLQSSDNDFRFLNIGNITDTLKHAAYERYSLAWQNTFKTGNKSKLETDLWYSSLSKDIPALISDTKDGKTHQDDDNLKMAVNYSSYNNHGSIRMRSGYFFDRTQYFDPEGTVKESLNQSFSVINEIETRIKIANNHSLNLGLNHTYEYAQSKSYVADTGRNRISVYSRYDLAFFENRLRLSPEGRKEFVPDEKIPFVYSLSGTFEIISGLTIKTLFAKHYALPVFNDLYWSEDAFAKGNPALKPEFGYNKEIGLSYIYHTPDLNLDHNLTLYRNKIVDQIIWLPDSTSKYTPQNIKFSDTRGLEFSGKMTKKISPISIHTNYLYGYTNARLYDSINDPDPTQKSYVPKHKASLTAGISYNQISFYYTQSFYSKRQINAMRELDAYSISNIHFNYLFKIKNMGFSASFKIKNLFNTSYQIMNGWAQPLRNYSIGINLNI
ncbi:MAG: TonB-dependent receptor plug domain-containing protein [Bacteroidales bacterium]|nr:TonB-dependent receptor plug domain-containing protein [Bacteroidales bacterium]MBN2819519.1 TonB-dependent receptor plug domain-containing protein [Bacteroidales bacterium]